MAADLYAHLDELVDTDPIRLRDEACALLDRAERAGAELERLRAYIAKMEAEPAGGEGELPTDPAELREMWTFITRQARWQWRMATKLRTERDEARARLAELENAITWETSCLSCARILDESRAADERAERAEAALERVRDKAASWARSVDVSNCHCGCTPWSEAGQEILQLLGEHGQPPQAYTTGKEG